MDPAIILARVVFASIMILVVQYVLKPALGLIYLFSCPSCNILVSGFVYVVLPIAIAFIAIYKIFGIFGGRPT